ncbi:MAG: hypothetical protein AAB516_01885 [Patescibacteria group bacterium]
MKKIVLILIIGILIFNFPGISIRPTKAILSLVPVDIANLVWDIANRAWTWFKGNWQHMMRDLIVRRIVDAMADDVIQWIQGGGEPGFVTDFGGFMEDAFQAGVGDVAKELNMAWLCSPFKAQLQLSVNYLPVQRFSQRVECTLDDIVANINDFYANFENGGWIAYNESWKPQNNFYGAMLMAHDEMLIRGSQEQEAAKNEALAGAGFLSQKRCETAANYIDRTTCESVESGTCAKDSEGDWCSANDIKIITPGDTIGEVIAKTAIKDFDYIDNVQSYVAAIVNAIINRLFSEGLALMKDSTSPGGTSYDYVSLGYGDVAQQDLENQKQQMNSEYKKFIQEKQYILNAKNQSLSYNQQALQTLQYIKNNCASCQPVVTDAEINNVQSEVNRLQNEVNELRAIINKINGWIAEIDNMSLDNRDREMAIVIQHYDEFTNEYAAEINQDIALGKKREAADSEAQSKQTELTNAQNRLNSCKTMNSCTIPTATSTQP